MTGLSIHYPMSFSCHPCMVRVTEVNTDPGLLSQICPLQTWTDTLGIPDPVLHASPSFSSCSTPFLLCTHLHPSYPACSLKSILGHARFSVVTCSYYPAHPYPVYLPLIFKTSHCCLLEVIWQLSVRQVNQLTQGHTARAAGLNPGAARPTQCLGHQLGYGERARDGSSSGC